MAIERKDVAVIGGGISGLAASVFLTRAGRKVTLYESSNQFGGLGTFFEYKNSSFERFYHCILPSDDHLLSLLSLLGLKEKVYWKESSFAMFSRNRLYPLNSPKDLLSFTALPFIDRLRLGVAALYARSCKGAGLDEITTKEWLQKFSGKRAFDLFFKPLLECKFGDRYDEVPALWFWRRFQREKAGPTEMKGYIRNGYRGITDAIVSYLKDQRVELLLNQAIEKLDLNEEGRPVVSTAHSMTSFNQVLYTGPFGVFPKLLGKEISTSTLDQTIDAQGVINVVLLLTKSLSPHYWIATPEAEIPFQGIVETSNVIDKKDSAGLNLVYLMNYLSRLDPLFSRDEKTIISEYVISLRSLFPELQAEDIKDAFLFRAPFVETVYTRGYLRKKPPLEFVPKKIYLATTAQVYPDVTSWNGSTGLSKMVVDEMMKHSNVHGDT